jgi:Glycosyltransferase family 28 C-terminal domain
MSGAVLWYVHDHGSGHLARAAAVLPHLSSKVVVAAGPGIAARAARVLDTAIVALPSDVPIEPAPTIGPWHHAPAGATQRRRTLGLVAAVEAHGCTTAVVDVSMEVTVLARLLGLRLVTVRQSGRRDDAPHRLGFASADVVWVPQHHDLEPLDGPPDERWTFTGAFSRFDDAPRVERVERGGRHAVLLVGAGGTSLQAEAWRAAPAPEGWMITIVGMPEQWQTGAIRCVGRLDDVHPVLAAADVVVTSAGWSAVADAVAVGARLVVVAEDRPFHEQATRAGALHAAGLAIALDHWPTPSELPDVLGAAARLDPDDWGAYYDGGGARRAARMIDELHAA